VLSSQDFGALLTAGSSDLQAARAALWVRTFDTQTSPPSIWRPRPTPTAIATATSLRRSDWQPFAQTDPDGRHLDYAAELEGRSVLDTSRCAFNALARLL
jgi:hypothetical protein